MYGRAKLDLLRLRLLLRAIIDTSGVPETLRLEQPALHGSSNQPSLDTSGTTRKDKCVEVGYPAPPVASR
jgi:hypothetical protein